MGVSTSRSRGVVSNPVWVKLIEIPNNDDSDDIKKVSESLKYTHTQMMAQRDIF